MERDRLERDRYERIGDERRRYEKLDDVSRYAPTSYERPPAPPLLSPIPASRDRERDRLERERRDGDRRRDSHYLPPPYSKVYYPPY